MANGIIIIDKPADWTSMDVCSKLRRLLDERRIGHAGTLDPMATGVLPVFVGRATRAVEFAESGGKTYVAGLKLGLETDTQDSTGQVLAERPVTCDRAAVEAVLEGFRGDILQVPPMYSALKVNGKKLYQLARKGKTVERKPRPITIFGLDILRQDAPDHYTIQVTCSKGTYIRTLCHDIGQALGCGGAMSALRRTRVGPFTEGVALEQVQRAADEGRGEALLAPVEGCFAHLPAVNADRREKDKFILNGAPYPCAAAPGRYRVLGPEGEFLMVGEVKDGKMTTVKSFFEVERS